MRVKSLYQGSQISRTTKIVSNYSKKPKKTNKKQKKQTKTKISEFFPKVRGTNPR